MVLETMFADFATKWVMTYYLEQDPERKANARQKMTEVRLKMATTGCLDGPLSLQFLPRLALQMNHG